MRRTLFPALLSMVIAVHAAAQVTVVDIVPNTMNNETSTNAEPNLTVDPTNPQRIAASVFMSALVGMTGGPILVSFDGGTTWTRKNIIPTCSGCSNTGDITLRFAVSGANQNQANLYAGILSNAPGTPGMAILRTFDQTLNSMMTSMTNRAGPDQPYIQARGLIGWFDPGKERTYVGSNDSGGGATSATVDHSLDTAAMAPAFTTTRIDFGVPNNQDNYQIRPAVGADGHVYAAFYRRLGFINNVGYNADVVIVRDDNWANVAMPWRSVSDSGNMVFGQRVASNITVTDDCCCGGCVKSPPVFPGQRQGGDLFLTTDPNNASIVYISYADRPMGDPMTLHLRRSDDAGQTWGADLLTVASAKNAAVAVASNGHIGYLYQQWTGTSPNHRWQTHLRRWNGMAWDDTLLSDMPCEAPCGWTGDYDYMTAVGKNFYGVFSALNTPSTLPLDTVFLRNHDGNIPTTLLKDDNTAVANSVDPFFFRTVEMAPSDDVYVRDWTDSNTVFDHGLEPSTHSDFFHTSDVWNQRMNDPLAFDGQNRPQSNDPWPMAMGQNFGFARVSREASLNAVDVELEFLFSDGGVGVNYVSAGTSPLHLNMGQAQANLTAGNGHAWDLPSGASNHVCLAVQISTATDPFIGPGLAGHAPGWPGTDLEIVNDNNKAQRNMHVYSGMGGGGGMSMYAIAHNAATFVRDVQIGLEAPRWTGPKGPTVAVVGEQEKRTIRGRTTLTLPGMKPGENRWIEVTIDDPSAKDDADAINLYEVVNGRMINGYAFVPRAGELDDVAASNLFQHAVVFTRMAAAFGVAEAKREAAEAAKTKIGSGDEYLDFLRKHAAAIRAAGERLLKLGGGDPFGVADALGRLDAAASPAAAANAHLTLLEKLDAFMTMLQKRDGDPADIAQTLRLQAERFRTPKLNDVAARFARGKGTAEEYSKLLQSLAADLRDPALRAAAASTKDLRRLQKLHRDALLR